MRRSILALGVSGFLAVSYLAMAAPPAERRRPLPPVISSQQIDRYDAIMKTKARLAEDPKSLADWIILGELCHEVALSLPEAQARDYVKSSREAYEQALALAPDNAGIRAAVQFARDLEANLDQFERARDQATETYLAARRRDLALANYTPAIAVYDPRARTAANVPAGPRPAVVAPATPAAPAEPAVGEEVVTNPPLKNDPTTDNATYGARLYYGALPTYRSFVGIDGADPLTYKEYSSAYYPPGLYTDPVIPPITPQRVGVTGLRAVTESPVVTPPVRPR